MSGVRRGTAIVVGGSSGIGRAVAVELARRGWTVGVTGRDAERLEQVRAACGPAARSEMIDLSRPEEAATGLIRFAEGQGGADLIVVSAGVGIHNPTFAWEPERATIEVNVAGFAAVCVAAFDHFRARGGGHLAGISSVISVRGDTPSPAYPASKAFVSNFLEGVRKKARKLNLPIAVTDILPGFVDTPMTKGQKRMFWLATPELAGRQIVDDLERRRRRTFVPRRWRLVYLLLAMLPGWVYDRV